MTLVAEAPDRQPQFEAQFRPIVAADVAQFEVLEIVPDPLMAPNLLHVVSFKRDSTAGVTESMRHRERAGAALQ
jgi:hypothetical protein